MKTRMIVGPSNRMNFCNWQEHPAFVASVYTGKVIAGVGFGNTEEDACNDALDDVASLGPRSAS